MPSSTSASTKAFRSTPCRNPFVSALLYVCSLFTMTPPDVLDTRPHLSGTLEGSDTIFLVDTGSVTVSYTHLTLPTTPYV